MFGPSGGGSGGGGARGAGRWATTLGPGRAADGAGSAAAWPGASARPRFMPSDRIAVVDDRRRPQPQARPPREEDVPRARPQTSSVGVSAKPAMRTASAQAVPGTVAAATQAGRRRSDASQQTERPVPAAALRAEAEELRARCEALEAALDELTATRSPRRVPAPARRCALLRHRLAQYERQVVRSSEVASEGRALAADAHAAIAGLSEQLSTLDGAASLTAARCNAMRQWCSDALSRMAQNAKDRAAAAATRGEGTFGTRVYPHARVVPEREDAAAQQWWDTLFVPAGGNRFVGPHAQRSPTVCEVARGEAVAGAARADVATVEDVLCDLAPRLRKLSTVLTASVVPSLAYEVASTTRSEVTRAADAAEEAADVLGELTAILPARGLLPNRGVRHSGPRGDRALKAASEGSVLAEALAERDALRDAVAALRDDALANNEHMAAYAAEIKELRASTAAIAQKVRDARRHSSARTRLLWGAREHVTRALTRLTRRVQVVAARGGWQQLEPSATPSSHGKHAQEEEEAAQAAETEAVALEAVLAAHEALLSSPGPEAVQRLVGAISRRKGALLGAVHGARGRAGLDRDAVVGELDDGSIPSLLTYRR